MPHHHTLHAQNVGPNLFMCNENSAYIMPCVTACAVTSCALCGMRMQASQAPYVYVVCQEFLVDVPFTQAEQYVSKLTASHFGTLNMKFANQNMLERILVAMHNKNKADCNETFRICAEEPISPQYKW